MGSEYMYCENEKCKWFGVVVVAGILTNEELKKKGKMKNKPKTENRESD
jgi:hypothetical protein